MKMSVVALMCHSIAGISQPVCREEIVVRQDLPMQACGFLAQQIIADWKERTIYRGEQWTVQGYKCAAGDYVPKDAI
jgi:hypothetical protein